MEFLIFIVVFAFIIGSIIGSFLNVVALRGLTGESIVLPPSHCTSCGNKLKPWHNIPILSYILLRGKCYFCKEKISIQYPIVEFITGVFFVLVFLKYGISVETIFGFIIASLLIVISVTDIKERVVFDGHTYTLVGAGLLYAIYLMIMQIVSVGQSSTQFQISTEWVLNNPLTVSVAGIIAGVVIMEIAARIGYLFAGSRAFGEGDTYIAAGLGAVFGWKNILVILILSVVIQLVLTLPLFFKKLIVKKEWHILIPLILFFTYVLIYFFLQKSPIFDNIYVVLLTITVMFALGIWSCVMIIRSLKNPESLTYLPFGPAMAIAGLLILLI